MTAPSARGPGPSVRALVVLAIAAFALIATSPPPPTLEGRIVGQVVLGGGESAERDLDVHVEPAGGGARTGSFDLTFQAASGLQTSYTNEVTLSLVSVSDGGGSIQPIPTFPVEQCLEGCDLAYRIRISAAPSVLPGSVVRYEVRVRLQYDSGPTLRDPGLLRLDLDGQATGPVAPLLSILVGGLALMGGIAAGPTIDAALRPRWRRLPAMALLGLPFGQIAWLVGGSLLSVIPYVTRGQIRLSPGGLLAIVDPWTVLLLATLGWTVWRGLHYWPADGGWLLGLAAVATVGIGGLWLAWWTTREAVVQPIVLGSEFALLGSLGGVVIGQAWRTNARARHDRWWAAFAVLGHGAVIVGLGVFAESLFNPFSTAPTLLLALIPAALVGIAFKRWLHGRQGWLVVLDSVIVVAGLISLWVWVSVSAGVSTGSPRLGTDAVALLITVAAAMVALATSLHAMPLVPGGDQEGGPAEDEAHPLAPA